MADELPLLRAGEPLVLLGARALYWPARQALLLADLHLGKADVFRRAGIALPAAVPARTCNACRGCWTRVPAARCGSWATSCTARRIVLRGTSNGWDGANAMPHWTCMSCAEIMTGSCRVPSCRCRSTTTVATVPASA